MIKTSRNDMMKLQFEFHFSFICELLKWCCDCISTFKIKKKNHVSYLELMDYCAVLSSTIALSEAGQT